MEKNKQFAATGWSFTLRGPSGGSLTNHVPVCGLGSPPPTKA